MDTNELQNTIDALCKPIKLIEEKSGSEADLVQPARAELAFFGMYLIFDEGSFDEEELDLLEKITGFKINRDYWNEIIELGRVDSEENYLSQPPHTFAVMVDVDNALYESGEVMTAYNAVYEVYKLMGETFINKKGSPDVKRQKKFERFLEMVEDYRRKNTKVPDTQEKTVIPSKKGVQAPKKS